MLQLYVSRGEFSKAAGVVEHLNELVAKMNLELSLAFELQISGQGNIQPYVGALMAIDEGLI